MKVFLSWSGERSKYLAGVFFEWLPEVLQAIKPWMSTEMEKGVSWDSELTSALLENKIGLFCLTPENLTSPYIHYEAGAISNIENSRNINFLFEVKRSDIKTALNKFQNVLNNRNELFKLIETINQQLIEAGETYLAQDKLRKAFDKSYPDLEAALKATPKIGEQYEKSTRSADDIMEEVLTTVRNIHSGLTLPITDMTSQIRDLKDQQERLQMVNIRLATSNQNLKDELKLTLEKFNLSQERELALRHGFSLGNNESKTISTLKTFTKGTDLD